MAVGRWTLDELAAQVALALGETAALLDGRVREVPDLRTIRYYTTLGLLDRPESFRGRTALYGRRHLLQLVAIKRLQSRGLTLAEVQAQLAGRTLSELEALAEAPKADQPTPNAAASRREFWKQAPAPPAQPQAVPLNDGLLLIVTAARELKPDDLEALRVAAAPLVHMLELRRILPRSERSRP